MSELQYICVVYKNPHVSELQYICVVCKNKKYIHIFLVEFEDNFVLLTFFIVLDKSKYFFLGYLYVNRLLKF